MKHTYVNYPNDSYLKTNFQIYIYSGIYFFNLCMVFVQQKSNKNSCKAKFFVLLYCLLYQTNGR